MSGEYDENEPLISFSVFWKDDLSPFDLVDGENIDGVIPFLRSRPYFYYALLGVFCVVHLQFLSWNHLLVTAFLIVCDFGRT